MASTDRLYISIYLICISLVLITSVPQHEKEALMDLYKATGGDQWQTRDGWGVGDPCSQSWFGVTCNNYRIHKIWLYHNNLQGTIPESIGSLTTLEELQLSANQGLRGSIPESVGKLKSLKGLYLSDSGLEGTVPSSLGELSSLTDLQIDNGNLLSGTIPETIGQLVQLQKLWLSRSMISGTIPSSFGGLRNLKQLVMSYNNLTGSIPASLGELSLLEEITLSHNKLSGPIPIGNLPSLKIMWLSDNQFNGTISTLIGGLKNLEDLYVANNRLSGSIPSEIGQISVLSSLNLNMNLFTGTIPSSLATISTLEIFKISRTRICGGCFPFSDEHVWRLCDIDGIQFVCDCPNSPCCKVNCTKELTCDNINPDNDNICALSNINCNEQFWEKGSDSRLALRQKLLTNHTVHLISTLQIDINLPHNSLQLEIKKLKNPIRKKILFITKHLVQWSSRMLPEQNTFDLTSNEIQAIGLYTFDLGEPDMNFYQQVNFILREQNSTEMIRVEGYLCYLFKALNKLPNIKKEVFRGIPVAMLPEIEKKYKANSIIHWSGFSSSSDNLELAKTFAGPNGIIISIQVLTGKYIYEYSIAPHPHEIMLSPKMQFRVISELIQGEDGYRYLFMEEILED